MDQVFPFGFSAATAFYLTLYVLTLVVHVVFMNYVFTGSAYLLLHELFGGEKKSDAAGAVQKEKGATIASTLRDWLPFSIGAAITAGVAPLLFLQILYQQRFYTANLLLFHRWMSILPVLIVGFYSAYLMKSRRFSSWGRVRRSLIAAFTFSCFLFTAYSWVENHVLSTTQGVWASHYESKAIIFRSLQILPRLGIWAIGGLPTMMLLVSLQLRDASARRAQVDGAEFGRAAVLALLGLAGAALAGVWFYLRVDDTARHALVGPVARWYAVLTGTGLIIETIAWVRVWQQRGYRPRFGLVIVGMLASLVGVTVMREGIRLSRVDVQALSERHEQAATVGGFWVFVACAVVVGMVIVLCVRGVRREIRGSINSGQ